MSADSGGVQPEGGRPASWLCRLIGHRWTRWQPAQPCDTVRACGRCGTREIVALHTWGGRDYDRDGACTCHSTCTKCGALRQEEGDWHTYEWNYDQPGNCASRLECTRCGTTLHRATRHAYQWEYFEPAACEGQDRCSRCGSTINQEVRHDAHWLPEAACQCICRRCARTETRRHDYSYTYATDLTPKTQQARQTAARLMEDHPSRCLQLWACAHCGRPDPLKHQEAHDWQETITSEDYYRDCSRCGRRDQFPWT
jgi:hypothetical protein